MFISSGKNLTSLYGFDSEVPVGIYKGECVIDFRRIVGDLKRMHL